jgi:predicted DCC family thiol-disulfide oxidoreductase YuxK
MTDTQETLVYDGACGVCRHWVDYWRRLTGDRISYRPYQEAAHDFPEIARDDFREAIQFIDSNGEVYGGAAATFRLLRDTPNGRGWWWAYQRIPGFAFAGERLYASLARHRGILSWLTWLLWGLPLERESYALTSWLFLRLLGAIYIAAFVSLGVQILGLVGSDGILPVGRYLDAARQGWGTAAYWRLPTLFWLNSSDAALLGGTAVGAALGLVVVLGRWVRAALAGLFILYLSYVYAGQVFTNYQWDQLLVEAGFLAIFLTSGSRIVVWLYRWLIFRYLFLSGLVKVLSSQPVWHDLAALKYYFRTEPLPTPLAWYAAKLPDWVLIAGTSATLVIELLIIFLVFLPRRPRAFAAWCILLFQFAIMLTGNYGFFNLLTIALCVFLFDDQALRHVMPHRLLSSIKERAPRPGRVATAVATTLAIVTLPVGVDRIWQATAGTSLPVVGALTNAISPLLIVNTYGPFATTTMVRPEIVVEGSDDGQKWREFVFRYKPGSVDRAPSWNIPHQPRLDWQMWFAAYGSSAENYWFENFLRRVLEGSPSVIALLGHNPFPDHPPKYVRALSYEYEFTDLDTRARTGDWWTRRQSGLYFPMVSLSELSRRSAAKVSNHPQR